MGAFSRDVWEESARTPELLIALLFISLSLLLSSPGLGEETALTPP